MQLCVRVARPEAARAPVSGESCECEGDVTIVTIVTEPADTQRDSEDTEPETGPARRHGENLAIE